MGKPMDRSNRFFGAPVPFEEAFPALEDAFIEYYEIGKGTNYEKWAPRPRKPRYRKPVSLRTIGGCKPCSNTRCNGGGFEIDFNVNEMVRLEQTKREFHESCPGDEGSPKGRRIGPPCLNTLYYRITLKYKPDQNPQER